MPMAQRQTTKDHKSAKRGSLVASDDQKAGEAGALWQLGALPPAALQRVLGLAAYPLSAWAQLDA